MWLPQKATIHPNGCRNRKLIINIQQSVMMQTRFTCKHALAAAAVCAAVLGGVSAPAWARTLRAQARLPYAQAAPADGDDDDKAGTTVQPADVTNLEGKEISYDTRNNYVTVGRPQEEGKMFVLYNVGAKKFLNLGSYWGTHAALSNVPRLFWLQRRNERAVSPTWGYLRYPETPGTSEGSFRKNFFALTTMQVGSMERSKQSNGTTDKTTAPHATYRYVRYYAPGVTDDAQAQDIITPGFEAKDGNNSFLNTAQNLALMRGGLIKAQIDMSACQGNGSSTDGKTHMETLLSLGADIAHWSLNGMPQNNVHIFGFRQDSKSYIRVCPVDASYSDATHKSGGNENPIAIGNDNLVTVVIGSTASGERVFTVNGVDCMPRNAQDNTSPIAPFFALEQVQVGSEEGITRSHGIYDRVSIVTAQSQDLVDSCVVKPGAHYTDDTKFYRQYKGNLMQWQVRADLDLTACTGTNENVLSVGTDIAQWASETGYNLHFYYSAGGKTIEVDAAKGAANTSNPYKEYKNANVSIANPRHVVLLIDQEGVHVDGTLVFATDGNDVLAYLLDQAASLQVGSRQSDSRLTEANNRSHAIYRSLAVTKAKKAFPDPDDNEMWDKRPFMKTLDGNLKQWEIVVNMDLSTCTSGSSNENVLSIGTDIASWSEGDNLHLYYTPSTNTLEVDAANSDNAKGIKTDINPANKADVTIKLNANGLYLDGQLVYGTDNPIIANLLDAATKALQVGSKEGNGSDAKYTGFTFTEQAVEPDPIPVPGVAWTGTKWDTGEQADFQNIDLSTKQIAVNLDLSSCTGTNENVLSIGNDIAVWGKENAYNLHLYYTKGASTMTVYSEKGENKTSNPYVEVKKTPAVADNSNVTVVLNKDGLYVGGRLVFGPTDKVVEYLLVNPTTIQVGSKEGNTRSHATYNKIAVEDYTQIVEPELFPSAGAVWDGTAFATTVSGNLADNPIEATIDLSTCTGKKENVLSVGTDIQYWGNEAAAAANANNIHIYYSKDESMVYLDVVYKSGYTQYQPKVTAGGTLTVKFTSDGLLINGTKIDDSQKKGGTAGALAHVIAHLSQEATTLQVGGKQGNALSHATYNTLTAGGTSLLGEAQASARVSLLADESGSTDGGSTESGSANSDIEATDVPAAQEYVPYDDFAAGGNAFGSESYNIAFADGDKIEATVDLSQATQVNENILSVGSGIAYWRDDATGTTYTNLHIYYAGTDADGGLTMSAAFVNADNKDGLKRAFSIPASSPVMKLTLSKDGLVVNGHDIFATTDTIPAITYNAEWAGDIVRFKWNKDENRFEHDINGILIEVKPGDEGYDDARGTKTSIATGYIYTDDAHNTGVLPLFMSSKFSQESTASGNEDVFFSWAPRLVNSDKWGNVGLFADRALPQTDISAIESLNCSQWFFEPVPESEKPEGEANHKLYRIYLKMDNVQMPTRVLKDGSTTDYTYTYLPQPGQQRYYLQGDRDHIYGNNMEDYYAKIDESKLDVTTVDAKNNGGSVEDNLDMWKVIDIREYDELFDSQKSEMTDMLDLSYLLSDPSFSRENHNLTGWTLTTDTEDKAVKTRIGYDYYSKKALTDTDYTDEAGNKDIGSGSSQRQVGSNQYNTVKARTNNHARYMGFDVRYNTKPVRLYQDVKVTNAGWYAVTCSGLSNAGAKLFMQVVNKDGVSAPVEMPLHVLSETELAGFNNPAKGWPFDRVDGTHPMPMYNALVAMNDRNVEDGTLPDRYTSQVAFFVDDKVLHDTYGGTMTLRLGISVPGTDGSEADGSGTATQAANGTATQALERKDESAEIAYSDRWTLVDDFHLLFGGRSEEPHLIIDEDRTSLDYLDRSAHLFDARPMRLHRTFQGNTWNTIILPVNLSKSDFVKLFGTMATKTADGSKLAELKGLTKNTIEFESAKEDEDGVLLHAFKPYIIKVDGEHEYGHGSDDDGDGTGDEQDYTARLAQRSNTAVFDDVTVPGQHFFLATATLQGKHYDSDKQQFYYSFGEDSKKPAGTELTFYDTAAKAYATGQMYTYRDNTLATRTDADAGDGALGLTTLRAYGTLCKNFYENEQGQNAIMPDTGDGCSYPTLQGGYVMRDGNLHLIKNSYGTLGLRCWFAPDDPSQQLSAETKVMIDGIVDGTTRIADVYGDTGTTVLPRFADGVYTIDGRKLRQGTSLQGLPAGLYIVNGRKVAVGM